MHNQSKKRATRSSRRRSQSNSSSSGSVSRMRVPSLPSTSAHTSMPADSSFPTFSHPPPLPSGSLSNPPSMPIEYAAPPFSYPPPPASPSSSRHAESPPSHRRAFAPYPAAQFSYPPPGMPGMPANGYSAPNAESGSGIAPSVPWFPLEESYHGPLSDNYLPPVASSGTGFASSSTAQLEAYDPHREWSSWSLSSDEDDEDDDAWYASHFAVDPPRLPEPSGSSFDAQSSAPSSSSPASSSRLFRSSTPLIIETIPSREQLTVEREMRRRQSRAAQMHACRICGKQFPRRSGLETHMNTHTGVRPYSCPFPGCEKVFNVLSNARRHHNTHFYQPPPPPPPEPVVIRFADPIVEDAPAPPRDAESQAAFNVRWAAHNGGQSTRRRKKKSTGAEDAEAPETEESSKHSRGPRPRDPDDRPRPS
ncbi:hypothetical protein R3P38DRAFT_2871663 [Favolaschia claudopus]|uniref:C2H2-type domain-containing protein n=1 Tax=Favolaschia claudopus TaxID=2862362 RepID=A0AAW0DBX2_9AGAR